METLAGEGEDEEEEDWSEDELDPPGFPRLRRQAAEPDYNHPLLTPLVRAQDAVARLEARAEMASDAVAEGLRARMSYLEAAGWLRCARTGRSPFPSGRRPSFIIIGSVCASVSTG